MKGILGREKRGIQKIIKTELLGSPLFIYPAICGGRIACKRPVGEGKLISGGMNKTPLINYFHVNKRRLVILIYATILQ